MTQDMKKDMILHTIAKLVVPLKRTMSPLEADSHSAPGGLENSLKKVSLLHRPTKLTSPTYEVNFPGTCTYLSRITLLLLLLLTLGINVSWGQIERNYTGTYYIANHANNGYSPTDKTNNYYLCPSEIYYDWNASTPNQMPFLTTNKPDPTGRPTEPIAKWNIEYKTSIDGIDYYYIKYIAPDGTEKYIVHNAIVISGKEARIRYHLQKNKDSDEDNNLFFFTQGYDKNNKLYKAFIHICPKAEASRTNGASLNPAKNNYPDYVGHSDNGAESWRQGSTTLYCGGLVGHYDLNDKTGVWFLEDIVARPVVSINGDGKAEITSSDANATYKYSTDGNPPSTAYDSENPIDITDVVTIKAIAIVDGEVSNEVTYTVGNGSPYLIQNQECTAYYMVPEQKESGNISINTSSVAGPKMEWFIRNAGAVNGLQYYYIVNKSTSINSSYNYLTYTASNGTKIYFESNSDKLPSGDAYKFYFRPNTDGSYSIYPKGVMEKSFHKDQGNRAYPNIVISSNISMPQGTWKFIPSSDYAYVAPTDDAGNALTLSAESSGVAYYYVASVGTADSYIVSNAATSTSGSNQDKSWMLMEAGTDSWQTYYYLVSAVTGKYLHFLGTSNSTSTLANAVEMTDLPDSPTDNYKFVLARATDANTYYIIPKTHYECFEANKFYCLSNTGSQINAVLTRAEKNNTDEDINAKWKFSSATLFCASPIAKLDNEGNVTLSCPTFGSEIRFTADGKNPDTEGATTNTYNTESWSPSTQALIKAIARLKSDNTVVSQDGITILNNPDVTLSQDTYTYNGEAQIPTISEVSITINGVKTTAASDTYEIDEYVNNTNAGSPSSENPPTVTLKDADAGDNWYIWNASQTFTINKAQLMAVNLENAEFIYNGEEQSVTITNVTAGDGTLVTVSDVPSEEYEVSGNSATNAGTHTVTVTPKSPSTNYDTDVSQSNSFTIGKKSIGDGTDPATASGITIDITWNDNESNPYTVEVKDGESLLAAGTEGTGHAYSLSATGDHDTKYYTVTITGANNYNGSFTAKYANVIFDSDGSPGAMWYGTFVAEANHAKPTDMTPYIITSVADNTATAVELDYIPNGVPVVLMNPEDAKGFQVQSGTGDISTAGNLLLVQDVDEEKATAEVYLLYKGEFVLNKKGTLEAGTVYLPVGGGSGARLKISRGDNTGIENIEYTIESQSDAWYTLDGRRLSSKPTKKGVYLQGGKKIVVK